MKIDARVTYALILAVALQAAGAFMWAGRASARLDAAERGIQDTQDISVRLARLDEQMAQTRQALTRIERRLDHD